MTGWAAVAVFVSLSTVGCDSQLVAAVAPIANDGRGFARSGLIYIGFVAGSRSGGFVWCRWASLSFSEVKTNGIKGHLSKQHVMLQHVCAQIMYDKQIRPVSRQPSSAD